MKRAKLFQNGGSQAVRLPVEFRFDGDEVFVSRDPATGGVVLTDRPRTSVDYWNEVFDLLDSMKNEGEEDDLFLADRPMNRPIQGRNVFDGDDVA